MLRPFSSRLVLVLAALVAASPLFAADPAKLTVKVDQPGVKISPLLYGLMTEEINHSYDGGLYAELIQNRIFRDDPKTPIHWSLQPSTGAKATMALDKADPINDTALTTSLRIDVTDIPPGGSVRLSNDGYWGVPVRAGQEYRASFYVKGSAGLTAPVRIGLQDDRQASHINGPIPTPQWKKHETKIHGTTIMSGVVIFESKGKFYLEFTEKGSYWLNLVSLMPPTYNNRPNGNRPDLMKLMAEMQPSFLRFPGGNYLEGDTFTETFFWKETLGPLENRPGHRCPWNYRSTDGMGLLEFLYWCEDLKVEPVLGVFAGYTLKGDVVTGARLQPWIDDALDELEYITGDTNTKWGAQRAKDGHPAPFKLTYVEIGNEDFFDQSGSYDHRYAAFHDAIKAKYPNLQLIATMPVKSRKPDLIDDHYYRSAVAMQNDVGHYDKTDRNGPKIFVGEWATTEGSPTPTMNAALGDAAWMTGMERNSDIVVMSCYAPLLVNINPGARQWGTNLIGYDALKSYGSPSYYAQKMFNQNRGDVVLPVELIAPPAPVVQMPPPHGGIGVATWSTDVDYTDLKVTTPDGRVLFQSDFKNTDGWKFFNGTWKAENNALHQTSDANEARAIAGDPSWTDYNYTLRARKNGGKEGFMAMFAVADSDNYIWWNVGGWTNTRTALELSEKGARRGIGNDTPLGVENGKWYDLRIEVRGNTYTCFLDGKQITRGTYAPPPTPNPLYATASRDNATGDVILKLVNVTAQAHRIELTLQGAPTVNASAMIETLSGDPGAVNSIEQPEKIAPKRSTITTASPRFTHEFPAHSVNVVRFKTK